MNPDQPFRAILIAGACVLLPFMLYHRIKAHTPEKLDRWQEGRVVLFTMRPVALAYAVGLIAYMSKPASMNWSAVAVPEGIRWAGVVLAVMAGVLLGWAVPTLGKNLTDTVVTREAATLVMAGPYRWVRHPFYVAVGLAVIGNALVAANWFMLVTGIVFLMLIRMRTRIEEEKLVARFGDSYRAYMERTGRFLPRIGERQVRGRSALSLAVALVMQSGCHRPSTELPSPGAPDDRGAELLAQIRAADSSAHRGSFAEALTTLFAPEGVYVSPFPGLSRGPAGARAWLARDSLNTRSTARWTVVHHGVSADGRDGYTYGYFDVIRPGGDTLFGKHHAYWRRAPDGRWQLLAFARGRRGAGDMTRDVPSPIRQTTPPQGDARVPRDTVTALREIFRTEGVFCDSAGGNVAAAFGGFAAPDAGKLEGGSQYVFGPTAIASLFANPPPGALGPVWKPEWGSVASSGDLGFTLGPAWARRPGPEQPQPASGGRYFTIWKRQPGGGWRYVVD